MHGCDVGSALLVNAEVDSMGGVVDGGVGVGLKTSPRRAAIEKAQAELRQEYDVREERRRELEFLEKGGNPLDFRFGNAASVSVQSTSLTDQHPEQFVTSEAKGSFALTASPRGDSVESSGRPEVPTLCEPNSADNLLLFDGDNDIPEEERNSVRISRRNNTAPSEQSSPMDGTQNAKESEDSAIRPYARRNRSRPNREGTHSSSTDKQGCGGQGLPSRRMLKNLKGQKSGTNNQKDQSLPSVTNVKSVKSNGDFSPKVATSDNLLDMDFDGAQAPEIYTGPAKDSPESKLDVTAPECLKESQHIQPSQTDTKEILTAAVSGRSDERDPLAPSILECLPCEATTKTENDISSVQVNGFSNLNRESKSLPNEGQISNAPGTKGLDSESSCTQTSLGLDVNNDTDVCTTRNDDIENIMETSDVEGLQIPAVDEMILEKSESRAADSNATVNNLQASGFHNSHSGSQVKLEGDMNESRSEVHNEVQLHPNTEGQQQSGCPVSEAEKKLHDMVDNGSIIKKENFSGRSQTPQDISICEVPETIMSGIDSTKGSDHQTPGDHLKVVDKAHEDSILEEARMIEAKRKRIAELSVRSLPSDNRQKSQWDYVLEEMSWLANDFAQERLWKLTAAAQICHRVALTSRLRIEEQQQQRGLKKVAHTLANAVNQFWHSAETLLNCDDSSDRQNIIEGPNKELELRWSKNFSLPMQRYAVRFLKYNNSLGPQLQAQAPATPERLSDLGITEMSWEDHLTEENLFYAVPSGAMETYRRSIESHLVLSERTSSSMQEEVETSMNDAGAEFSQDALYDEDEGETSTYYLPGAFDGSKSSTYNQKKRKGFKSSRTYEAGADFPYGPCSTTNQQSMLMGKRPASLNVGSIPTKRMRTASRQRVVSPFGAGATGNVQTQIKTDASSGDTNSFQDDQSTLHGGSQFQKSMEVESVGEFERHLSYDHAETSMKPKKKKKQKHLGSTYDKGWQMDSPTHNDLRDYSKKRSESHHFESNGTIGLYGQHNAKKPKILKQSLDNTYDGMIPMIGSLPSPVASQMSNMTNPSKFIKLIGGRDRGRKTKLKIPVGQPGYTSPWSLFEDQALVVLVHDMGPNWELISDAINSTLHLKCIFRTPKECKERHKSLMDLNTADGADSAEDSGSSQPYPSTIPGIPKGSARQLFQRLQEPMEEDTLKSHFERIIKIGQKHHYRRSQNDNQDPKQVTTVHNSHVFALSQVCPNNLNGGSLTPLDLCDATSSSPDLSSGYQGSHTSGLPMANQGAMTSLLPSGPNASLQGTSGMVLGSNLSSPSGTLSATVRYGGPRGSALPVEEQKRMQQYNQMLAGRNIQQPSLLVPGALPGTDRGVRMVAGANVMGMMCGMNRTAASRPGFQGMASSSMVGIPSPVHSGAGSGPANLVLRPREGHMMRPAHNPDHQRQLMTPELQMQVNQGNGQGIPPFNGLSSGFPSQATSSGAQMYPGHQHQLSPQQSHAIGSPHHPHLQGPNHVTGSQQQAYAMQMAKGRQLHQQRFLQQQQQFAPSNPLVPHVQPQVQLPISSLQNSSQIQSQNSPHAAAMPPSTPSSPLAPTSSQHQQKHHLPPHGMSQNPGASGLTNQMGKQRQRQQHHHLQQSGRHHPQQRPFGQSQQQTKHSKGMGRGNSMAHQNLSIDPVNMPVDPSHLNGLSMPPGSQALEKGEQIMQLMQGQTAYSGSGISPATSKPLVSQSSNNSQLQQKLHSSPATSSLKQLQQKPSHSDNNAQGQAPAVPSGHAISASHQSVSTETISSSHQQQPQLQQQKQVNQTQPYVQRVQLNRQVNSELPIKSQSDLASAEEQPVNSTSPAGSSMGIPQSCLDSSNVVPVSSAIAQWKSSEAAYDSNLPNSTAQEGSLGSTSLTNSPGNESPAPVSQGLGPRQVSGNFTSHGHIAGAQWPQKQLLQKSPSLPLPSQQLYEQQEQQQQPEQELPLHQLPLSQHSQRQMQHLEGGLYMMPGNSKSE
ncbi:chromatin modification-related protein EAF1 B-like isoform X2 [Argentina anserina]|uniref:chromatin modification-related protein EAF1 B-like isoform X2 n=1 Tax=Argentina anserina TaxID=57926 RepID=UPI002176656A|nr:chromatin modification-related protein EAF1 B-like isoform X2 [Potentilla anserina]